MQASDTRPLNSQPKPPVEIATPGDEHEFISLSSLLKTNIGPDARESSKLFSDAAVAPESVRVNEYLGRLHGGMPPYCVVLIEHYLTHDIEIFRPEAGKSRNDRSFVLCELAEDASAEDRAESEQAWRMLAVLAGLIINHNGTLLNSSIIDEARADFGILDSALSNRSMWPIAYRDVSQAVSSLLMDYVIESNRIMRDEAKESMPHQELTAETIPETLEIVSDTQADNLGDRLPEPHHSRALKALNNVNFRDKKHARRAKAPWRVLMDIPQRRRENTNHDMLITTISKAETHNNAHTLVLHLGQFGEASQVGTPIGVIWRAAAACFGLYATSNFNLEEEGYTHPRMQKLLNRYKTEVRSVIELWPIAGHASLKKMALARLDAAIEKYTAQSGNNQAFDFNGEQTPAAPLADNAITNTATTKASAIAPDASSATKEQVMPSTVAIEPSSIHATIATAAGSPDATSSVDHLLNAALSANQQARIALQTSINETEERIKQREATAQHMMMMNAQDALSVNRMRKRVALLDALLESEDM